MEYVEKLPSYFKENIRYFITEDESSVIRILPSSYLTDDCQELFYVVEENEKQEKRIQNLVPMTKDYIKDVFGIDLN